MAVVYPEMERTPEDDWDDDHSGCNDYNCPCWDFPL